MKKLLLFWFLISFSVFSQNDQQKKETYFVDRILKDHPVKYFDLRTYIKGKKNITKESLEELIKIAQKQNYTIAEIYALNSLGNRYRRKSEFSKSIEKHQEALRLAEQINNLDAKIHSLNMLGVCYRWKFDAKNAIESHQRVLRLTEELKSDDPSVKLSIGVAQNSVGEIYRELKQHELAIEQFEDAIITHKSIDNKLGLAINNACLGNTYENHGDLNQALYYYKKSLEYNSGINSEEGKVICQNRMANVLIKKGNYKEALRTIESIYDASKNLSSKVYFAQTLAVLAWAKQKNGNLKGAETDFIDSYVFYNKLGVKDSNYVELCFNISGFYKEKKDSKKELFFYKEAVEQERNISGEQNILYVRNLISKYNSQAKTIKIRQLENQTKLNSYETSRTRNILIITLVCLALLSVALYSVYRQRLLNNDKKVLTLEQDALQAQMNPHFIFNALNSIKLYIINNDQKKAVYYLNKFSKLIRNILDASKSKEVSLKEELITMDLYMSIENIRFDNQINYETEVDESLNLDTIKLPPLVLQPFLENAIWHGLSSKTDGEKKVFLSVKKSDKDMLAITIIDNGVGRDVAMKIKENKSKSLQRKSVGIDLTKERLQTFTLDFLGEFSLEYVDLKDENGQALGTKVILQIPIS